MASLKGNTRLRAPGPDVCVCVCFFFFCFLPQRVKRRKIRAVWVWLKIESSEGQTAGFGTHVSTYQGSILVPVFEPQPFGAKSVFETKPIVAMVSIREKQTRVVQHSHSGLNPFPTRTVASV